MHLLPLRLEAEVTDNAGTRLETSDLEGTGRAFGLGPLEVTMELHDTGVDWSLANRGDVPVQVRSVALVYAVIGARGPVRMFRNGYQSWTPSSVAVLGVDVDPSVRADFPFLQAVHHADQRRARPGELRSEWVTVLADGWGPDDTAVLLAFDGGDRHDGTLRLHRGDEDIEVRAEAFFGDATLAPGTVRPLHAVMVVDGVVDGVSALLEGWADRVGRVGGARTDAPFQVGWCSWYPVSYTHLTLPTNREV